MENNRRNRVLMSSFVVGISLLGLWSLYYPTVTGTVESRTITATQPVPYSYTSVIETTSGLGTYTIAWPYEQLSESCGTGGSCSNYVVTQSSYVTTTAPNIYFTTQEFQTQYTTTTTFTTTSRRTGAIPLFVASGLSDTEFAAFAILVLVLVGGLIRFLITRSPRKAHN